jgi:hypothetical protein
VSELRRDFTPVLVWALLLSGLTLGQLAFMAETYSYGLLGGAALLALLLGSLLLARRPQVERGRFVPELSYPAVALGLGLAGVVVGLALGLWLLLPGLGLAVLGAGALLRERLAQPGEDA